MPAFFLHFGMAATITFQLISSLFMEAPAPNSNNFTGTSAFTLHMYAGLIAVIIIVLHWIWSTVDKKGISSFNHLFPWGKSGRQAIYQDIKTLIINKQIPAATTGPGLSGLIHGLGFLAATAMAATGAVLFYFYYYHFAENSFFRGIRMVAQFSSKFHLGILVWSCSNGRPSLLVRKKTKTRSSIIDSQVLILPSQHQFYRLYIDQDNSIKN
ncbi:cytochrome b/b6 domain-containing protein [Piscirickettsia litoralis]|uniref:Cytochrome b561 bacterial/Ni-hydrogenase domain-containing protein n=1 Tax=Piscirickettsia litoralis TaxID=1891921 RepID=A0ABX3A0H1_9GAMM|nr:cytochrome b/b6 domain-containing protein [Piscirickettsia litoralis]ODN42356.1 hypothetical protein BGC07_04680 [Piscirickettsia litoralis]